MILFKIWVQGHRMTHVLETLCVRKRVTAFALLWLRQKTTQICPPSKRRQNSKCTMSDENISTLKGSLFNHKSTSTL